MHLAIKTFNYMYEERLGFVHKHWTEEKKAFGYLRCIEYCLPHEWCRAVSYNTAGNLCRFSTSFDHNQLVQIKENSKWNVYVESEGKWETFPNFHGKYWQNKDKKSRHLISQ
jgi:hypothetical protein